MLPNEEFRHGPMSARGIPSEREAIGRGGGPASPPPPTPPRDRAAMRGLPDGRADRGLLDRTRPRRGLLRGCRQRLVLGRGGGIECGALLLDRRGARGTP